MKTFNNETELQHISMILDSINDEIITNDNLDELHQEVFNTSPFIIGYYEGEKWLTENFDSIFAAIDIVKEYEIENFDVFNTEINGESIANMISYICGEHVISKYKLNGFDTVEELKEKLLEILP